MIKLKTLCSGILFLLVTGCQTGFTERFIAKESPTNWVGESPIVLMQAKGNPTQVINNEGYQYIIYMTSDNVSFGNNEGEVSAGNFTIKNGYPQAQPIGSHFCQQTYIAQDGIIIKAEQRGTGCINVTDKAPTDE